MCTHANRMRRYWKVNNWIRWPIDLGPWIRLRRSAGVGSNPIGDIYLHLEFSLPARSLQPGEARTNEIKHDIHLELKVYREKMAQCLCKFPVALKYNRLNASGNISLFNDRIKLIQV